MFRKFQPNDCYYCKTRANSVTCTLPNHFVANLTLPDDLIESTTFLTEMHVNYSNYLHNLSQRNSDSQQSTRSQSVDHTSQTFALPTFDTFSQGGVTIHSLTTENSQSNTAETLSPAIADSKPAIATDEHPSLQNTLEAKDPPSSPSLPTQVEFTLVTTRGKAKTPAPVEVPSLPEPSPKAFVPTHELPSISRDITLAVTFAHLIRTKLLKDTTLRQFYDCTFDTINKSKPDATARLGKYPDTLKSLSRNFIKNLNPLTLDSWFRLELPPHPEASELELVNHPLFSCQPQAEHLNYRLDNSLIRFALTSTFTGKIHRAFITTFHSSIRKQLTDFKSERLFDWLTKVRKDSPTAYDGDENFFTPKSKHSTTKQASNPAVFTKHSCPPLPGDTETFVNHVLPHIIEAEQATLKKFKLPEVPGYTNVELLTEMFTELIAHFPIWIRPNFVVTTAQIESISQFMSLSVTTPDQTNILWTLNTLLPKVKSKKMA